MLTYYKSFLGEWLALSDDLMPQAFYSKDGQTFYAFKRTGFGNGSMTVLFPHEPRWKASIELRGETKILSVEGVRDQPIFRKSTPSEEPAFVPLPNNRELCGIYKLPNGEYLCWTGYEFYFEYKTVRVWVGPLDAMLEGTVTEASSLLIQTTLGDLNTSRRTWEGYSMEPLDADRYQIMESAICAVVTKK